MAQTPLTDVERCAHYRQLAVQFRDWAASESNQQARDGWHRNTIGWSSN